MDTYLMHELLATLDDAIQLPEQFDGSYGEASPFRSHRGHVLPGPYTLIGTTSSSTVSNSQAPGISSDDPTSIEVDNTEHFRRKRNGQASGFSSKKVYDENRCFRCYEKGHFGRDCLTFKYYAPEGKNNGGRYDDNFNSGQRFSRPKGKGCGKN